MSTPSILLYQQKLLFQLSVWSLLNLFIGGVVLAVSHAGLFWSAFWGMNAIWGLVNLTIASFGLYGVVRKIRSGIPDEEQERLRLLRVLRWNAFLDVGYVAVGIGMVVWGSTPLLHGFGWGIILQGGFLSLFDLWHYHRGGSV